MHYAADGFIIAPEWDAKRQVETIRQLLDQGADIHLQDKNGATPLHRAVRTRCAAAVRFLLQAGADPTTRNKSGSTAFHLAVQNTGRIWAVAIAAVVFGLGHLALGPLAVGAAALLGLGLGLIMVLHGSVWPAAFAPGLVDATTFALLP